MAFANERMSIISIWRRYPVFFSTVLLIYSGSSSSKTSFHLCRRHAYFNHLRHHHYGRLLLHFHPNVRPFARDKCGLVLFENCVTNVYQRARWQINVVSNNTWLRCFLLHFIPLLWENFHNNCLLLKWKLDEIIISACTRLLQVRQRRRNWK